MGERLPRGLNKSIDEQLDRALLPGRIAVALGKTQMLRTFLGFGTPADQVVSDWLTHLI